jgi:hypothetical protein
MIFLISVSQVTKTIGVSHQGSGLFYFLNSFFSFFPDNICSFKNCSVDNKHLNFLIKELFFVVSTSRDKTQPNMADSLCRPQSGD